MYKYRMTQAEMNVSVFYCIRLIHLIFLISVWHVQANELMQAQDKKLTISSCRLMHRPMFAVVTAFVLYTLLSLFLLKKQPSVIYGLLSIMLGAFIIMACKPEGWFYSFKWNDCADTLETNAIISRFTLLSYALIVLGGFETTQWCIQRFRQNSTRALTLTVIALALLGVCRLFVWFAHKS